VPNRFGGEKKDKMTTIDRDFDLLNSHEKRIEQSCQRLFKENPTLDAVLIEWKKGKPSITGAYTKSNYDTPNRGLMNKVAGFSVFSFTDAEVDGIASVYRTKGRGEGTSVLVW
jgi:hypothetical protein